MEEVSHKSLDQFSEQWLTVAGQPELSAEWEWKGKTSSVDIQCRQMQDQYLFKFPLELRLIDKDGKIISDTLIRMSDKGASFNWHVGNQPDSLIIDPEVKLLFDRR